MKKKARLESSKSADLRGVKGGFIVIEDDVLARDQGDDSSEYIVIEDHIIFRETP